ncbi:glycosyltransferase family 2 protein [Demequina muriae]|uniref:Glycosyltransferase family 2 protein n=1 Tax=Demequina muriae TaxID=3051664 RepID=A0ABT8GKH9_9MICO|nr:glycosyltransferase family 2 protein [Demequina sp. EGI L300058]MDN4481759.1 glycosyltransferase family 2 protein [Demequina sp. EGI L300058]
MADPAAPLGHRTSHVVVVLNWHGRADTLLCVESLLADPDAPHVLVVDNGSEDGTVEEVERRWPGVFTVQTGENLGFAGGMNRGITWARSHGATVITVLNNDTVVPVGTMGVLSAAAASGLCAISPEVRYRDHPDRVWFGGGTLAPPDWFPHHTPDAMLAPSHEGTRTVDVLSGCCVTASAEVWDRVGGFNERYFLNFEDSEWSVRAARAGVRLQVRTDAVILHAVSASFTGAAASLGTYYYVRNGLDFNRVAGGDRRSRRRFVTRVARDAAARRRRERAWRAAARELRMVAHGWADFSRGRMGPAPARLARTTARWASAGAQPL